MSIGHFRFSVFFCVVLSASYGFAGGKQSTETPVEEPPEDWVKTGDALKTLVRYNVLSEHPSPVKSVIVIGFFEDAIVTNKKKIIKLSDIYENWAKVEPNNPTHNRHVLDPKKHKVGVAQAFYANGDVLILSDPNKYRAYAWRAHDWQLLSPTLPSKSKKTNTNCDTQVCETRVELSTVTTRADCADDKLCNEHRCAMNHLECGHFICKECFPLENPAACVSCLADKISTGQ